MSRVLSRFLQHVNSINYFSDITDWHKDAGTSKDVSTCVRWLASTYIRQLRSGLPQCCMHEDILGMDGAILPGGFKERPSPQAATHPLPPPGAKPGIARIFSPQTCSTTAPFGTNPVSTYRQKAIASLRARATIMIRRILLPCPFTRPSNHNVSWLLGW